MISGILNNIKFHFNKALIKSKLAFIAALISISLSGLPAKSVEEEPWLSNRAAVIGIDAVGQCHSRPGKSTPDETNKLYSEVKEQCAGTVSKFKWAIRSDKG
jgi:hypothetical protein